MLAFARADEEGERLGITYYQGNIASMPFLRDRQFDLVVTNIVLDDCEDYQGAFREFARVLKPGGTYLHVGLHPCFSTPGCGWVKDDQGNKLYFKVNDYLAEGSTGLIRWPQDAMEPTVNFYRTLSMYFNALVDSGFRVERIIEPRPTEEAVQQAPAIADILRIPHFIAMVCRLPARLAA
jgi:ubiquinone/menaquinone biosynthesis C-methylase UbiE